jgi:predicted dehydrogenase
VATQHVAAFRENPHTRVVAISNRTVAHAEKLAAEYGIDAACYGTLEEGLAHPGVDVVSICTPQYVHAENIVQIAAAGRHMVIEKPAVTTLEDLRVARDAVRQAGVKTVVSFVLRWNPLCQTLKRMIQDDFFGRIFHVEVDYLSNMSSWWAGFSTNRQKETGISPFILAGCHALDMARWLASGPEETGALPEEVFAYSGGLRQGNPEEYNYFTHTWHQGLPLEFVGMEVALMRFRNGVLAKVSANLEPVQPYEFPIRIFGDRGTVRNNQFWSHRIPGQKDWITIPTICPDSSDVTHHPFQGEMDHFVDCILQDRESHANLEDAVHTHEIAFAVMQCAETGLPVRLPLI